MACPPLPSDAQRRAAIAADGMTKPWPDASDGPSARRTWPAARPPPLWGLGCRWTAIVGPCGAPRKGACPPFRPPSYPHERAFAERPCGTSARLGQASARSARDPAGRSGASGGRRPARGPRTGRRRAAGSRRGRPSRRARRPPPTPAIPTDVSSMQPRNVRKPSSRAARRASPGRPDPAALGELHVDAGDDADERRRGRRSVTALSSATIGSDERSWSQPSWSSRARRERLLDQLDAEPHELRQQVARRRRGGQPVLASTRIGPPKTAADRLERREVVPARRHLILSAGKSARPGGPLGDDRRLVDADREVGRRDLGRTGRAARGPACPRTLPARSWRAMSSAHFAPPWSGDRGRPSRSPAAARPSRPSARELADRVEQERQDRGHRLGRLAVEPVRVALADPDDAREPVVAQLDDDGRDARGRRRGPSGRSGTGRAGRGGGPRGVSVRLTQPRRPTAGRRPRSRICGPEPARRRSGPGRRPAARSRRRSRRYSARASSSSGIERRVERDRDDLRRRDEPGDPLVEVDERPGRSAIGNDALGQVVEVVLGQAGLVDQDHRLRRRAVDQRQRHRRVGRVVERALALDDDPVAAAPRPPRPSTRRCPGRSR